MDLAEFAKAVQESAIACRKTHDDPNAWQTPLGLEGPNGLVYATNGSLYIGDHIKRNSTSTTGLYIGWDSGIFGVNASTDWLSPHLTPEETEIVVNLANLLTADAYEFDIQRGLLMYRVRGTSDWKVVRAPDGEYREMEKPCLVFPFRLDEKRKIWTKTNSDNGSRP